MRQFTIIFMAAFAGQTIAHPWYQKQSKSDEPRDMHSSYGQVAEGEKGGFLMNRIGLSTADVYIANAVMGAKYWDRNLCLSITLA